MLNKLRRQLRQAELKGTGVISASRPRQSREWERRCCNPYGHGDARASGSDALSIFGLYHRLDLATRTLSGLERRLICFPGQPISGNLIMVAAVLAAVGVVLVLGASAMRGLGVYGKIVHATGQVLLG